MSDMCNIEMPDHTARLDIKQQPGALTQFGSFLIFASLIVCGTGGALELMDATPYECRARLEGDRGITEGTAITYMLCGSLLMVGWSCCLLGGLQRMVGTHFALQIGLSLLVTLALAVWVLVQTDGRGR
jgi:hypothetical protein